MPTKKNFQDAASIAAKVFEDVTSNLKGRSYEKIREAVKDAMLTKFVGQPMLGMVLESGQLVSFVNKDVDAFFDHDLLAAVRLFLAGAKGSFGLCITCSLDADRQLVVGARGQTISVAFYPSSGLVLWGSEQAAVKAALIGEKPEESEHGRQTEKQIKDREIMLSIMSPEQRTQFWAIVGDEEDLDAGACRLDLDDLGGEIVLIDWGTGPASNSSLTTHLPIHTMMNGKLTLTVSEESPKNQEKFKKRLVPLHKNPLIEPLPNAEKDHVAKDISDIPQLLSEIQTSWDTA
jgi:hypothetical protein